LPECLAVASLDRFRIGAKAERRRCERRSLAVVYLGKALRHIRPTIRRSDRWLTELFPILVPNLPSDLPAKVDRLIKKETEAQLRRFEAQAKKLPRQRLGANAARAAGMAPVKAGSSEMAGRPRGAVWFSSVKITATWRPMATTRIGQRIDGMRRPPRPSGNVRCRL
jgi:hypothetical protein